MDTEKIRKIAKKAGPIMWEVTKTFGPTLLTIVISKKAIPSMTENEVLHEKLKNINMSSFLDSVKSKQ